IRDFHVTGVQTCALPIYPGQSALEVVLTKLHAGGKFSTNVYETSGGLHGVGLSVVNALSDSLTVEVARDRQLWRQRYARGIPLRSEERRVGEGRGLARAR